jgi:hypothetical protein
MWSTARCCLGRHGRENHGVWPRGRACSLMEPAHAGRRKWSVEYPHRVDAGINHGRRASRGATCPASVILHEPLRRSLLVAAGGHRVPPACRCTLSYGHPGAHQGLAYDTGRRRGWFRWDEWGFRLGSHAEPPNQRPRPDRPEPGPGLGRAPVDPTTPTPAAPLAADRPYAGGADHPHATPEPSSLAQALRTVAAALERLAEVIAPEHDASGPQARHARHRR